MQKIFPSKLNQGDEIRIIASSQSMALISKTNKEIARHRFADLGFKLTFGKHVDEADEFDSSSVKSRIEDLHEAFATKKVKAILTVLGGFNSNQLLPYIDWKIIKNNPKILCGYSDITALNNAVFAKTGLVTYSGPHYSTFSQKLYFDYTLEYFKKCLFADEPFEIKSSDKWSDDRWYKSQLRRKLIKNNGMMVINEGEASGTILGANLCTFNLLQGTKYFPKLKNSLLFIEDDNESLRYHFDRDLQSIIQLPDFKYVKGIVIGRFQNASNITLDILTKIIKTKKELDCIPVVANVDFGHTDPKITFPIGGEARLLARDKKIKLEIIKH